MTSYAFSLATHACNRRIITQPLQFNCRMIGAYDLKGLCNEKDKVLINVLKASVIVLFLVMALTACGQQAARNERENAMTALGHRLFNDKRLSADGNSSCASCHVASKHFTDGRPVSVGMHGAKGTRNAPSLQDVQLMSTFFWDGREAHLEDVVLQPFTNPVEMGLANQTVLMQRLSENAEYRFLLKSAYGDETADADKVIAALSAYLRSLPLKPTLYDRHLASKNDAPLSDDQAAGLALFKGKAACAECHHPTGTPATFTDNRFHHTGIGFEQVAGNIAAMLQRLDGLQRQHKPFGEAILTDVQIAELGRFAVTRRPTDLGAFRTPSLRDVASTAPYMHDGSIATLPEAVEREIYYRSLARGRPITLTMDEQRQLLAFLGTLSTTTLPQ